MIFQQIDPEFQKLREKWYQDENVAFNLIEELKHREGVFLRKGAVLRCLKINAVSYFYRNAERYHFFSEPLNLYSSLAHFPNLPMFSFNIKTKKTETDTFNKNYLSFMQGYDFLIDIDNENVELAYYTTARIKRIFDDRNVPYSLIFSGKKGFHIRVDWSSFPQWIRDLGWQEITNLFKKFAENIKEVEMMPDIDTSIFDLRRIRKAAYSVVYPYYLVALPLSDAQFDDFSLADVSLPNLLSQTSKMYKRGLLTRPGTPEAFGNLIKEYTQDD